MELPTGFRFAGVHSGLRANEPGRLDLALIVSDMPATAVGVFTQNRVCAAPVQVSRQRVPQTTARAVIVCSGNANACTGEQGIQDAERMTELVAHHLACPSEQVLVCSTGVIGRPLPMPVFETGIPLAFADLGADTAALERAASAILTTDTRIKLAEATLSTGQMVGFAKGAAMIGPNMATMLGFILTDATINPSDAQRILRESVAQTFNCISVEGHTSTNDTVLLLANGQGQVLTGAGLDEFARQVQEVCGSLAKQIAADAEGAEHLVTILVSGTESDEDARQIAKVVAESALVKSAIYGADPNWGRFVSAAGYSGVHFAETDLTLFMGDLELYRAGTPLPFDVQAASDYLRNNREILLDFRFTLGEGKCTFYTCDLTPEYVRLNSDYTT
ncbi:MAG: bifunctional glutamate N-acetyltransferase/amino-acid acetyltransferase ArgJ [Gemmataceae bacterium]|jgi:glutamate N-acetyltransferase/amino-acid N-acetyltransferase|nr:bifunctional glutamate N-acetyltransferase/amino-acid acetyltransferase ArgJ [Gemmataceae bacterium]